MSRAYIHQHERKFCLDKICQFNFRRSTKQVARYDSWPHHIAAGDLNQDGYSDLVVANSHADNIGIFLNNGNGTFQPQVTSSSGYGSRPYSVAVGHLNNDVYLDLVVANFGTNSIGVLLGYGNGSFTTPIYTSLGSSCPLSLALADFNNDIALDIVVANYGTFTIVILLGASDGSFRMHGIYEMGYDSIPYSIAVADLNEDNRLDIVVVNYGTSELAVLLATTDQSFRLQKYWTDFDSHPSSVTIGHLNNDSIPDIAIAYSGTSSIAIFTGYGDGTFRNLVNYALDVDVRPQFISVGDFNNDTQVDIVVLDSKYGNIFIIKGNRNLDFSIITRHSTGYNSHPSAFVIDDFDNDHQLDIAVSNNGTNNILVLRSYATYPNASSVGSYILEGNAFIYSMDIIDVNHDHHLDIIVPNEATNNVIVFLNLGNGTLGNQQTYNMGNLSGPNFVITGDVNNDHHPDIIVALFELGRIGILLGNDNGNFIHGPTFVTRNASSRNTLAAGDLNNDGNLDIVVGNYGNGNVNSYFGFGDGTFSNMSEIFRPINSELMCVRVSDMNNDQMLDVIVAGFQTEGSGIAVALGYGNGSFRDPLLISAEIGYFDTFIVGDANMDGRVDIVYTSSVFVYVGVLLGRGDGLFETVVRYYTPAFYAPFSISLGYYNNDPFLDIVVSTSSYFYRNSSINIYLGTGNGSFIPSSKLSNGRYSIPSVIMLADFDNDHQQDIALLTYSQISVIDLFLVHYDGDFNNEKRYTTGSSPHPISIGIDDLDNDKQSDLIVANPGNEEIELLFHYDNGIFLNRSLLFTGRGSNPTSLTTADFNRDGLLDIAVVDTWHHNMKVYLGLGNRCFAREHVYSIGAGSAPNSIVAGDVNEDGRMDIVIANEETDHVAVFLAFDYISFTDYSIKIAGEDLSPRYLVTADFNRDHRLDIAVTNTDRHYVSIYLGRGNGTFFEHTRLSTGGSLQPKSLSVGDLNHDDCLDIVVANIDNIDVFLGHGNGQFQWLISYRSENRASPLSLALADLDKDNQLDIVVTLDTGDDTGGIWIFWGYSDGSFYKEVVYSVLDPASLRWIAVDDLNKDTNLDIVVVNTYAHHVFILFGYGNGTFGNVTTLSTGEDSNPVCVTFGDLNRDQSIDIVVSNRKFPIVSLFFGYGNGTFSARKSFEIRQSAYFWPTTYFRPIVVADMNNDTILDILVAAAADDDEGDISVAIYYGLGDGNFTLYTTHPTGFASELTMMVVGDFNNDSKVDLAITDWDENNVGVFIQTSIEPFGPSARFFTGNQSHPNSVVLGDFNNDDHLDIAVANSASNTFGILLGYGDGKFADQLPHFTGVNSLPSAIATDHFNDDAYLDIVVVNTATDCICIFLGQGNGSFIQMTNYSTGVRSIPVAIVVKDMNRDGHADLVVANRGSNEVLIFTGIENGIFDQPKRYSIDFNARPEAVAIGDIDNDGMLDIAVVNDGAGYVEIFLQTC